MLRRPSKNLKFYSRIGPTTPRMGDFLPERRRRMLYFSALSQSQPRTDGTWRRRRILKTMREKRTVLSLNLVC